MSPLRVPSGRLARLGVAAYGVIFAALGAAAACTSYADDGASRYIQEQLRARHTPGAAVAVVQGGKVLEEVLYGSASLQLGVPVHRHTQFQLASVTKTFTGLALLLLEQQGILSLADPVGNYLTGLPAAWKDVSLRELVGHTSGLPDVIESPDRPLSSAELGRTEDEALQFAESQPIRAAPGEQYEYNQTNYVLLKQVIEHVTRTSLHQFLVSHLVPRTSGWAWGDCRTIVPLRTEMYRLRHDNYTENAGQLYTYPRYLEAAAGLNASISDMEAFGAALTSGKLLSGSELHRLEEPIRTRDGHRVDMGQDSHFEGLLAPSIGFDFADNSDGRFPRVFMAGGSAVVVMFFPRQSLFVAVLTNLQTTEDPIEIAEGVARFYIGSLVPMF